MAEAVATRSPLRQMTETTPTCLWNDSAALEELTYSIEHGAVGATCNPVIVLDVLKQEMSLWRDHIRTLIREMPTATEGQIGWRVVEDISRRSAALLLPAFQEYKGKNGRLSVQTDPRLFRNPEAIVEQAIRFSQLAPNIIVKIPATKAGIVAIEEATYLGININATVCFSMPQCVAVAEAYERGLQRRRSDGLRESDVAGSVCTIMVGRLDDWLKIVAEAKDVTVDPGTLDWAGVAVFKNTYRLFQDRGYRMRLLSAAYRNHYHWSELIGGDVVISPPYKWQVRFNASDVKVMSRINNPVDPKMVSALMRFEDFRRAYTPDGMSVAEFDSFAPTVRTLRQFTTACHDLEKLIRDFMLPEPTG